MNYELPYSGLPQVTGIEFDEFTPKMAKEYFDWYINDREHRLRILKEYLREILYLIFDYPHKHYTFKYFEV